MLQRKFKEILLHQGALFSTKSFEIQFCRHCHGDFAKKKIYGSYLGFCVLSVVNMGKRKENSSKLFYVWMV